MMPSQPHTVDSTSVMEVDFGTRQALPPEEELPEVGASVAEEVRGSAPGASIYPPEAPPEPPRRRRLVGVLLGALALCAFVAIVWFAYDRGLNSGYRDEVPTIQAERGPIKVKPENPGGLVVPNQDKMVLNQPGEGGEEPVERLLSGPEAPQPPEPLVAPEPSGPLVTISPDGSLPQGEAQPEAGLEPEAAAPEAQAAVTESATSDPVAEQGGEQGADPAADAGHGDRHARSGRG